MYEIIIVLYAIVALAIIGLVLIQHGKGADMGASFGAGASATIFGSVLSVLWCAHKLAVPAIGSDV